MAIIQATDTITTTIMRTLNIKRVIPHTQLSHSNRIMHITQRNLQIICKPLMATQIPIITMGDMVNNTGNEPFRGILIGYLTCDVSRQAL
jgi:hypothetical protein